MARSTPKGLYRPNGGDVWAGRWSMGKRPDGKTDRRFTNYRTTNYKLAVEMHKAWTDKLEAERRGLYDPRAENMSKPLQPYIDAWRDYMEHHQGSTPAHVRMVTKRLQTIVDGCGWRTPADIAPGNVRDYVTAMAKVDGKTATVNGKQRKIRHGTRTRRYYMQAAKQFTKWLQTETGVDPLADLVLVGLSTTAAKRDVRHNRREITTDERAWLLHGLKERPRQFHKATANDRRLIYLMALATGMRAKEVTAVTWADLKLDGNRAAVKVLTAYAKNGESRTIPLPAHMAAELRAERARRPDDHATAKVFRMPAPWYVARMLRTDWDTARQLYLDDATTAAERVKREQDHVCVYASPGNEFLDFHAFRHTWATDMLRTARDEDGNVIKRGTPVHVVQKLGGWSNPDVLLKNYAHVIEDDEQHAIDEITNPERALRVHSAPAASA